MILWLVSQPSLASSTTIDRHSLLVSFLSVTDKQLQWQTQERLSLLKEALLTLEDHGLSASNYQIARLTALIDRMETEPVEVSAAEDALISGAYLEAIADLKHGRTRHLDIEPYLNFQQPTQSTLSSIIDLAVTHLDQPKKAFQLARPQIPEYENLVTALVRLNSEIDEKRPLPVISPDRPSLRLGMSDIRVPLLRQHLLPDEYVESTLYDEPLRDAVKAYQQQKGLDADGIAGPQTLARLNQTPEKILHLVKINLERWRRVNHALTEDRVIANIPGAQLDYYQNNERVFHSRTQVGRRDRPTPLMISEISHFTLNPTWTIPPTIYRNDKLPAIQADISYLQSNRLTVLDPQGNQLDPDSIDWDNPGSILLRQSAGPHNALGQVVIRFPNQQSIYLHDTPNQRLFDRNERFFSSGCIRVEDAKTLVSQLLDATQTPQAPQFDNLLISGSTRNLNIAKPITIILGYWTVEADEQGQVTLFTDVYNLDASFESAL